MNLFQTSGLSFPLSRSCRLAAFLALPLALGAHSAPAETAPATRALRQPPAVASSSSQAASPATPKKQRPLPPLPPGVEELSFSEFYKTPVGPRGLEPTKRLQSLDGKRVRIFGFMVHEDLTPCSECARTTHNGHPLPSWVGATVPGRMIFSPCPVTVNFSHYGLSDDLPPQTVFVTVPDRFGQPVPYTPGPMLLTGILHVGNKQESDARISFVRMNLDLPAPQADRAQVSSASQPNPPHQPTNP